MFKLDSDAHATHIYSRKDFYKICLSTGKSIIHYADRSFEAEGIVLFFWQSSRTLFLGDYFHKLGYTCLFSDDFIKLSDHAESLQQSPLFKIGVNQLKITDEQRTFLSALFQR